MAVKGFKKYDEHGNVCGIEKYDYNSLENLPNINQLVKEAVGSYVDSGAFEVDLSDYYNKDQTQALIPTKVSALENDSKYQSDTQVIALINNAISQQTHWRFEKVNVLPTTGVENIIYLVPNTKSTTDNIYDEYIWIASINDYEIIGSTAIDLSGYYKKTETYSSTEIDSKVANLESSKVTKPTTAKIGEFLIVKAVDSKGVPTEFETIQLDSVEDGKDGTSVTVKGVAQSTEDGGINYVYFSDGKTIEIRNGTKGSKGDDGKTSYQYAQDGGYTGTEEEFAEKLAKDWVLKSEVVDANTVLFYADGNEVEY